MCFILTINGFFLDKIVIERQDCISIYGKGTLVKSVLKPTFAYISSLLPTPKEFVKELNQILFNFLWKGPDKVTRVSVINEYDKGGLKMTDVDSIVMSLRLAWLKRLFGGNDEFWKRYLLHLLEPYGGFFFFKCNVDIRDYPNLPQFYSELLQWWSEFREMPVSEKDWVHVIWNNKDVRIDKKPIFYKNYYDLGTIYICDLQLHKSVNDSFHLILEMISKTNFLVWAGLRHSIPHSLKSSTYNAAIGPLQLILEDNIFDVSKKKSKDYYKGLVGRKAQCPKSINKLQNNFNLSLQQLTQIFQLPHTVALEPYVKVFQYISSQWYPVYQFQVVPNRLHFKRSLLLLYPGIRDAVSSFLFLSIFKDFMVRLWIFLAPTHK